MDAKYTTRFSNVHLIYESFENNRCLATDDDARKLMTA